MARESPSTSHMLQWVDNNEKSLYDILSVLKITFKMSFLWGYLLWQRACAEIWQRPVRQVSRPTITK